MNNIKLLRVSRNMTQGELAKQANVTQTSVSQWESGKNNPDTQTSKILASFFNVTIDYLLGESSEPGIYNASGITGSNLIQGSGTITVNHSDSLTKEEAELLRIYQSLDVRGRAKLLNAAFSIEDEYKKSEG